MLKLVSVPRLPAVRQPGVFYALELHPWHLPETFDGLPEAFLAELPYADAAGEVGLDRLKGPDLAVQQAFLDAVLRQAAGHGKPVVFHCVRAFPELLKAVRPYPEMRKLLHGFRGNEKNRKMLQDAGFLLTGSREMLDGLETDAEGLSIREVYKRCGVREEDSADRLLQFLGRQPAASVPCR